MVIILSSVILGIDLNKKSEDKQTQKTVKKALEKAGHNVTMAEVGPGNLQNLMAKKSSKGKIAVFIVNGADLQTYKDTYVGMKNGYYNTKYCYFGLEGWISPKTCSCNGAKTAKLKKAHDDASSASFTADIVGMTTHEVMEKYKEYIAYACGSNAEELANNLVKVMGGENNSSSSDSNSATSIKEALRDVLSAWDGDVECFLRDDTVYVQKISDPTSAKLSLIESKDIFYDSVTVTDVNPSTVNHLKVTYMDKLITVEDDSLIRRFGKISSTVSANDAKNLKEAQSFARREWAKLRRDNDHKLECKVLGNAKWKVGEWCRVYLPSFDIDDYMYIIKVSQEDDDGNWVCSLTLVDYPPSLGEPKEEENADNKEEST